MTNLDLFKLLWSIFFIIHSLVVLYFHKSFLSTKEDIRQLYGDVPEAALSNNLVRSYKELKEVRNLFIFLAVTTLVTVLASSFLGNLVRS